MKYFVILSLVAFCAYQLTSIQAAPNAREKRWVATGDCPANTTTEQECIDYVHRDGKGCSRVTVHGQSYEIAGCGVTFCEIDGKSFKATKEDLSKPYPECCPDC